MSGAHELVRQRARELGVALAGRRIQAAAADRHAAAVSQLGQRLLATAR